MLVPAGDGQAPVSPAARARPPVRERVRTGRSPRSRTSSTWDRVVLAVAALGLLINAAVMLRGHRGRRDRGSVGGVLDQLLLILMLIEILYTVQVSFREHVLVPEPFVLVA